jgi:hypothetical protein
MMWKLKYMQQSNFSPAIRDPKQPEITIYVLQAETYSFFFLSFFLFLGGGGGGGGGVVSKKTSRNNANPSKNKSK